MKKKELLEYLELLKTFYVFVVGNQKSANTIQALIVKLKENSLQELTKELTSFKRRAKQ